MQNCCTSEETAADILISPIFIKRSFLVIMYSASFMVTVPHISIIHCLCLSSHKLNLQAFVRPCLSSREKDENRSTKRSLRLPIGSGHSAIRQKEVGHLIPFTQSNTSNLTLISNLTVKRKVKSEQVNLQPGLFASVHP